MGPALFPVTRFFCEWPSMLLSYELIARFSPLGYDPPVFALPSPTSEPSPLRLGPQDSLPFC